MLYTSIHLCICKLVVSKYNIYKPIVTFVILSRLYINVNGELNKKVESK